jgi:predicted TPR repeat methyltransferase
MSAVEGTNVGMFLRSIHAVSSPDDCSAIYDKWAQTYDVDVRHAAVDYVGPAMTAHAVVMAGCNVNGSILDAGCGTGLVGIELQKLSATNIDGVDISPGMLKVARESGAYRGLSVVDMSKPIDIQDESYDAITCCGTFTEAHVRASPAFQELVRIVKKGSFIAFTVVDEVWISLGYKAEIERLAAMGAVEVLSTDQVEYRRGTDMKARMVVLKRR